MVSVTALTHQNAAYERPKSRHFQALGNIETLTEKKKHIISRPIFLEKKSKTKTKFINLTPKSLKCLHNFEN